MYFSPDGVGEWVLPVAHYNRHLFILIMIKKINAIYEWRKIKDRHLVASSGNSFATTRVFSAAGEVAGEKYFLHFRK